MIQWNLPEALKQNGYATVSQIQRALKTRCGIELSRQALTKLMVTPPKELKLTTAQFFCDLLQMPLDSFLQIQPDLLPQSLPKPIKPYAPKPKGAELLMSNPMRFLG
jgi:Cro/C1-type HTH DNA-binding domain